MAVLGKSGEVVAVRGIHRRSHAVTREKAAESRVDGERGLMRTKG
jgi:hypothetical protein